VPAAQPHQRILDLPVELLGVDGQEGRTAGNPREIRDVDVGQPGRVLRDVDAADAEGLGGVDAEVGLERPRYGLRVAHPQLVHQRRRNHARIVSRRPVCRQARVLDAGDERPEVEAGGRFRRRRQAACRLPLRRVELELAPVVADEERILVRDLVVDAPGEDVVGHLAVHGRRVVVEVPGAVRQRVNAGNVDADGVLPVRGDDVARERIAQELRIRRAHRCVRVEIRVRSRRQRIVDEDQVAVRLAEVAEVAAPRALGGHRVDEHLAARLLQPGVVGEEEGPVVAVVQPGDDERPAGRGAELMTIERRLRIHEDAAIGLRDLADEEIAGVECVVAQVLEGGAVQRVAARLRGDGDDAGAAAELGGEDAGEHLELAHLLDRRGDDDRVERVLVVVDAVDQPRIRVRLVAERVEVRRPARVEGAGAGEVLVRLSRRDAGRQIHEGREVAAVERQFLDRAFLDDGADFGGIRPQQRRFGHHGRRLLDAAHLERHVDAGALIDLQDDAFADPLPEAGHADFDGVGARRQERHRVAARLVRDEAVARPLVHLAHGHAGARHHAARITHGADDGPGRDLGRGGRRVDDYGGQGCCDERSAHRVLLRAANGCAEPLTGRDACQPLTH
jgi:hypothetical protein